MAKSNVARNAPEEVDAYLASLSADVGAALADVRDVIRRAAPGATERISYRIPIFRLTRDLVGISAHGKHCSLHTMSPSLVRGMRDELKGVEMSGATIHFTPDSPLPAAMVERIVKARIDELR